MKKQILGIAITFILTACGNDHQDEIVTTKPVVSSTSSPASSTATAPVASMSTSPISNPVIQQPAPTPSPTTVTSINDIPAPTHGLMGYIEGKPFFVGRGIAAIDRNNPGEIYVYTTHSQDPSGFACDNVPQVANVYPAGIYTPKEYDGFNFRFKITADRQWITERGTDVGTAEATFTSAGPNYGSTSTPATIGIVKITKMTLTSVEGWIIASRDSDTAISGLFKLVLCH